MNRITSCIMLYPSPMDKPGPCANATCRDEGTSQENFPVAAFAKPADQSETRERYPQANGAT